MTASCRFHRPSRGGWATRENAETIVAKIRNLLSKLHADEAGNIELPGSGNGSPIFTTGNNPGFFFPDMPLIKRVDRINSAGTPIKRGLVKNEDELLQVAESWAGGSLDAWNGPRTKSFESNTRIYSCDGNYRIEVELKGHSTTNEGPHVTFEQKNADGTWSVIDKVFMEYYENYRADPEFWRHNR